MGVGVGVGAGVIVFSTSLVPGHLLSRWQVDLVKRNTNLRNVQDNYFFFKTAVGGGCCHEGVSPMSPVGPPCAVRVPLLSLLCVLGALCPL